MKAALYVPGVKAPITVEGRWSAFHIEFMINGQTHFATTDIGVKGIDVPVSVTIDTDGKVSGIEVIRR